MTEPDLGRLIWLAWRVEEDGRLVAVATLRRDEDCEDEGYEKERWEFESMEAAADVLGESFGEVVRRVLETGRRAGRWRP